MCTFSVLSLVAGSGDRDGPGFWRVPVERGPLPEATVASLSLWTGRSQIGATREQLPSPCGWGEETSEARPEI